MKKNLIKFFEINLVFKCGVINHSQSSSGSFSSESSFLAEAFLSSAIASKDYLPSFYDCDAFNPSFSSIIDISSWLMAGWESWTTVLLPWSLAYLSSQRMHLEFLIYFKRHPAQSSSSTCSSICGKPFTLGFPTMSGLTVLSSYSWCLSVSSPSLSILVFLLLRFSRWLVPALMLLASLSILLSFYLVVFLATDFSSFSLASAFIFFL